MVKHQAISPQTGVDLAAPAPVAPTTVRISRDVIDPSQEKNGPYVESTGGVEDASTMAGAVQIRGERGGGGWMVALAVRDMVTLLTPEAARRYAAELVDYAELVEGKRW